MAAALIIRLDVMTTDKGQRLSFLPHNRSSSGSTLVVVVVVAQWADGLEAYIVNSLLVLNEVSPLHCHRDTVTMA